MDGNRQAYYQALIEHFPMPLVVVGGEDGIVRMSNQQHWAGLHINAGDHFVTSLRKLCVPDDLKQIEQKLLTSLGAVEDHSIECKIQGHTQNLTWARLDFRRLPDQDILVLFHDITKEKHAVDEARLLENQLHVVFAESLDIIVLVDEQERILQVNPVVELLLGYRPEELIGKPFSVMLRLSQQNESEFFESLADYGAVFTALPFVRKDSSICYMELTATLVPWQRNHAVMITLRDVTLKEELQRELVAVQRAQEKHQHEKALVNARANMIFVIAHQFRTPLTSISMSAQILDRYKGRISPQQQQTHLSRIKDHTDEMNAMIQDMLDARQAFNHGLEFQPVAINLGEMCKEIFEEIAEQHPDTHRFQFKDSSRSEDALLDPALIKYIVDNLLTNAVKYSPDGGLVSMNVREEEGQYLLVVSDEGVGIPEESYETIFGLFQRGSNVGKIQGTGIGLGLVHICVTQHNGEIDFISKVGQGSTFTVRLPIVRPGTSPATAAQED